MAKTSNSTIKKKTLMIKKKFIHQWGKGLRIRHIAHSLCFARYNGLNRLIGLTSTVLARHSFRTAVIVSLKSGTDTQKAIAGGFSVLATLLPPPILFLKLGEPGCKKQQRSGTAFGQLRRKLEPFGVLGKRCGQAVPRKTIGAMGAISKKHPPQYQTIYSEKPGKWPMRRQSKMGGLELTLSLVKPIEIDPLT